MFPTRHVLLAVVLATFRVDAWSMGLRSFVALPLETGGAVARLFGETNRDTEIDILTTELAYGLSGTQTLIFGLPYRLSPAGRERTGDLSALYRHTVWFHDFPGGTDRLSLLGGAVFPSDQDRDARAGRGGRDLVPRKTRMGF